MKHIFIGLHSALLLVLLLGCSASQSANQPETQTYPFETPSDSVLNPYVQNGLLGSGVNMGNALEAPNEGDWGVVIKDAYFDSIKSAGFSSVRIPIRWSAHAQADSPYTIDADFFNRVDHVTSEALNNGLAVIINIHHYMEIMSSPLQQKTRFLTLWRQIAQHIQTISGSFLF